MKKPYIVLFCAVVVCGIIITYFQLNKNSLIENNYTKADLHIAIICDGNRRYGKKKGVGKLGGYNTGERNCFECIKWCNNMKVKVLTLFLFGEDNFKRDKKEVKYIFELLENAIYTRYKDYVMKNNIKFKLLTTTQNVPDVAKKSFLNCQQLQKDTQYHTGMVLQLCIGYSGTTDIEQAASKTLIESSNFQDNLTTKGIPDPDILIRTSGEKRLSNFMLYQLAYTELFFLDKQWPEFTKRDLVKVLHDYSKRNKRFGK